MGWSRKREWDKKTKPKLSKKEDAEKEAKKEFDGKNEKAERKKIKWKEFWMEETEATEETEETEETVETEETEESTDDAAKTYQGSTILYVIAFCHFILWHHL